MLEAFTHIIFFTTKFLSITVRDYTKTAENSVTKRSGIMRTILLMLDCSLTTD